MHWKRRCWKCKNEKFWQTQIILVQKYSSRSNYENAFPHLIFSIRAPVLFYLSKSLQKSDKMLGKPRILSLFTNSFDKFNKILYFRLSYSLMVVIEISAGFLICQSADINSMRSNIQNYFSQSRYHGDNTAAYKLKARKFIYDEFSKYGLETLYQNFTGTLYPNVSDMYF